MTGVVLVTDGEQRAALATVRSLGAAGWTPVVCSMEPGSLAGASRYVERDVAVPDPLASPGAFASAIIALAQQESARLVVPISEPALLALLPQRSRLSPAVLPFPDPDHFLRISDKAFLMKCAAEVGIAVPAQVELASKRQLASIEPAVRFPAVLKPARSIGESNGRREKVGVRYAADVAELRREVDLLTDASFPLLIQQRVVGPGVGIFLLVWEGRIVARFAHRRLREKPPSGGVSVYRESIAADPDLVAKSAALLERFDWSGPAMIEYKLDAASGIPYLMEINGRFWGSLQLAIDSGVDFPLLLARLATGEHVAPVEHYRTGIRSRWWWGDVDHLLTRLRKSDAELALPSDAPSRARSVAQFLRLWRPGDRSEVFRLSDPWPGVRESLSWISRLLPHTDRAKTLRPAD